MPLYKLTYFDLRARAEPIRMLLHAAGQPFEDVRIPVGDPAFAALKPRTNCLPYGQLPVLEVDGVTIAQSAAIMRYLARQHGFEAASTIDAAICDGLLENLVGDFISDYKDYIFVAAGYMEGDRKAVFEEYLPKRGQHFGYYTRLLKQNKTGSGYVVGDRMTYADLALACHMEMLEVHDLEGPERMYEGNEEIKAHKEKVFSDPRLQDYLANRPKAKY